MTDAPFGRRLAARLLDLLFALPLTFVMLIPVGIVMAPVLLALDEHSAAHNTAIAIDVWATFFLAYVALEWFLLVAREGQTLGKGLLGLRAVSSSDRPLHLGPALVRLVVLLAPFVLFSLAGRDNGADNGWDYLADIGLLVLIVSLVLPLCPATAGARSTISLPAAESSWPHGAGSTSERICR